MKETLGWCFLGLSLVCAIVAFWIECRERRNVEVLEWWRRADPESYIGPSSPGEDADERLYRNPRFVVAVILGLIFGGVGMYLIGMFGG